MTIQAATDTLQDDRSVSLRSLFADESWYLDNRNPAGKREVIHWARPLLSGGSLREPANLALLNGCKEYIYLRLQGSGTLSKLQASTAARHALYLLQICDWMITVGLSSFSEISQSEISQLRGVLTERLGVWNSQAQRFINVSKKISDRTVEETLEPLRAMVHERRLLDDVPDWNPALDSGRLEWRRNRVNGIPAIPDEISIPLFAEALRWVVDVGPELLAAKETIEKSYEAEIGRKAFGKLTSGGRTFRARAALKNLSSSIVVNGKCVALSSLTRRQFTTLVMFLETACFIVIAGFTGMRISELSSIETNCLEVKRASDGKQHLWIQSKLVKTVPDQPEPNAWIAGIDNPENPVRLAVDVAKRITAFERNAYSLTALFVTNASTFEKIKAPKKGKRDNRPAAMNVAVMNRRLNEFAAFVGSNSEWRLTTHQFRKTFARFVARHHRMALLALKRHFKHMSLAMTQVYHGTDLQLLELVSIERQIEAEEALEEILGASFLGGRMGEQIVRHNTQFRGAAGSAALKSYVRALMNNGDVPMISTAIGFCFAFHDTARCGFDAAKQGFEGCLPCANLMISLRHLPAWKERLEMMDVFRQQMIEGGVWSDTRQDDWAQRRAKTAAVIEGLEEQVRAMRKGGNAGSEHDRCSNAAQ